MKTKSITHNTYLHPKFRNLSNESSSRIYMTLTDENVSKTQSHMTILQVRYSPLKSIRFVYPPKITLGVNVFCAINIVYIYIVC